MCCHVFDVVIDSCFVLADSTRRVVFTSVRAADSQTNRLLSVFSSTRTADIDVPPFTRSASEPPFAAVDREGGGRASPATPHIERERGRPLKARAFDDKSHVHKPKSKRSSLAHSPSPFHKRDRSRERGPFASQGRSRRYGSDAHASVSGAGGVSPPGPSPPSSRPNTREREREQHSKPIGSLYARHTEDEQFASSSRIHGARKSWSESSSGRGAGGGGSHHRLVSEINPSSWKGGNQPRTSSQRHGNSGLSSLPPPSSSSNPNRRVTSTNGVKTSGRLPIVRSRSDSCGSARSGRSDDDTGPFTTNSERTKSGSRTPFSAIRLGVNGVLGGADTDTQRHHRSSSHSHSSENRRSVPFVYVSLSGQIRTTRIKSYSCTVHACTDRTKFL